MINFVSSINLYLKVKKPHLGIFWYSDTGLKWTNWASGLASDYSPLFSNCMMTSEALCPVLGFQVDERHQLTGGRPPR